MKYTMGNIRKMKNWSDAELFAENTASAIYAEKMAAFENTTIDKMTNKRVKHEGMPNFNKIYKEELSKANKHSKRTAAPTE